MKILISLMICLPLAANTWTYGGYSVNPDRTVVTFLATDDDGTPKELSIPSTRWGDCATSALNKVAECLADRVYKWIERENEKEALADLLPAGPIVPKLALPLTPIPEDPENAAKTNFSQKITRLRGCVEAVRLGVLPDSTCDPLRSELFTRWTELTNAQKLAYLERIR